MPTEDDPVLKSTAFASQWKTLSHLRGNKSGGGLTGKLRKIGLVNPIRYGRGAPRPCWVYRRGHAAARPYH